MRPVLAVKVNYMLELRNSNQDIVAPYAKKFLAPVRGR